MDSTETKAASNSQQCLSVTSVQSTAKIPKSLQQHPEVNCGHTGIDSFKKLLYILEHWQRDAVFNYPKDNDDSVLPNALQGKTSSPFCNI